jgi:Sulfotransferase family/Glycosyl transferase family 2
MLQIEALIAVRNGAKTLERVLDHLAANSIRTHVLDCGSTDATLKIVDAHRENPVSSVTRLPFDGVIRWIPRLQWKAKVCSSSSADWIIHLDADEILESPRAGESLRAFVERIDSLRFDVIDGEDFVFVPTSVDEEHDRDFIESMRRYYFLSTPQRFSYRMARRSAGSPNWIATLSSGGKLLDQKLAAEKVRVRRYLGVSRAHLQSQFLSPVFDANELLHGAHRDRVPTSEQFVELPEPKRTFDVDRDGWRTDAPMPAHLVFHSSIRYVPPAPIMADATRLPFPFVVGVSRSGTTLLRMLMDSHPQLAMTPETHWLKDVMRQLATQPRDTAALKSIIVHEPHWGDMGFSGDELDGILAAHDANDPAATIRAIYRAYLARFPGKTRVGDKTPVHLGRMCAIARVIPEAHFIHIVRDGRDVALSYRNVWFGPGKNPATAAAHWMWRIRDARQQAQFLPRYLEVRYEDLLADPEKVLRSIGDFIGLPFDPIQLKAHERAGERLDELTDLVHATHVISAEQRREIRSRTTSPPDPSRAERWRTEMSADDVRQFERVAGNMLADLGYARGSDE